MTDLILCLDLRKNLQLLIRHEISPLRHFAGFLTEDLILGRAVLTTINFVNCHL